MIRLILAPSLSRALDLDGVTRAGERRIDLAASRLDRALELLFADHPKLRSYLLDEHGRVRQHVAIFIDGRAIRDKHDLAIDLPDGSEVHLLQALSGG